MATTTHALPTPSATIRACPGGALFGHYKPRPANPFRHGGLFALLGRNSPQPVWLRRGPRGSMTHTYIEGYSATGGDAPPLSALHDEKIFTPKRDAIIRFLNSFGLSDDDAAEVVRRVGTAP